MNNAEVVDALLRSERERAESMLRSLAAVAAETPIPSALSGPFFVDSRKVDKACPACNRGPKHYEGCSRVECPERRALTCAARDDDQWQREREV